MMKHTSSKWSKSMGSKQTK